MGDSYRTWRRRGIGAMLQVVVGILLVSILGLMLFTTETTTQAEIRQSLTDSSVSYDSKMRLMNLYETSYMVPFEQNPRLIKTMSFACQYAEEPSWVYSSSDELPIRYEVDEYVRDYLDRTFHQEYFFYSECDPHNETRRLEIGERPPEDQEEVMVAQLEMPQAYENRTEAYLYRWN